MTSVMTESGNKSLEMPSRRQNNLFIKLAACLCMIALDCSRGVLAALSKNAAGSYSYSTASIPAIAETIKLCMTAFALLLESRAGGSFKQQLDPHSLVRFVVLAVLYTTQNNLLFFTLRVVDPATFQLLGNLKIPLTALLLWWFLNMKFTKRQLLAVGLQCLGVTVSQLDFSAAGKSGDSRPGLTTEISAQGMVLMGCMIGITSGANVFNEAVLKGTSEVSIHWQNFQLYVFSCLLSWMVFITQQGSLFTTGLTAGYNLFTWLSVLNLAFLGLALSAVLKYADNIWRVFASAAAMFVAGYISWLWLGVVMRPAFLVGCVMAAGALFLYSQ